MTKTARNTKSVTLASAGTATAKGTRAKATMTTAQKLKAALDASADKAMARKATTKGKAMPASATEPNVAAGQTKAATVMTMLRAEEGTTLEAIQKATGWQAHSVRGFLSGTVRKKKEIALTSERGEDGIRRYHIDDAAAVTA
jgi:hypothetical protein